MEGQGLLSAGWGAPRLCLAEALQRCGSCTAWPLSHCPCDDSVSFGHTVNASGQGCLGGEGVASPTLSQVEGPPLPTHPVFCELPAVLVAPSWMLEALTLTHLPFLGPQQ